MIFILSVVPVLVYCFILFPLMKIHWINKKIPEGAKRFWLSLFLFTLPFGDQLLGVFVSKILDLTIGGIRVYAVADDEAAQRAYWLRRDYRNQFDIARDFGPNGIYKATYLTKDLQYMRDVTINSCKSEKRGGTPQENCRRAEAFIKERNLTIHTFTLDPDTIPLERDKDGYIRGSHLEPTWVISGESQLERAYFNYCSSDSNSLPESDPKYRFSCRNSERLIQRYDLKNIIKIPEEVLYEFERESYHLFFPILNIDITKEYGEDSLRGVRLYTEMKVAFRRGWYFTFLHYVGLFGGSGVTEYPSHMRTSKYKKLYDTRTLEEIVIPNPYLISEKQGE